MQDLVFKLIPSRQYLLALLTILLCSLWILLSLPIDGRMKCLGLIIIGAYGNQLFWRYGLLRHKHAVVEIRRLGDGRWLLQTQASAYIGELCGDSTVTGLISILRFRTAESFWKKSCILMRDSLEPDRYRQLLVVLRMKA